jgi:alkanesulfonate monooxygenase SsuD/methylene tetrahydromethanopterin reductase-like flavin-dependent oxidoreductase (luciferase family)
VKRIGFLSFGHWTPAPYSEVRTASDALLQSIELAVAAEELGLDGAYFRVHHFARQLGSPFPLLAAVGARTKTIEIGTAVIDMRYENPMYMAEDAGAADIIAGGRLQLGISRGSPEQVIDGWRYFGYAPRDGETAADMARRHAEVFLERLKGEGFAEPNPRPMFPNPPGLLRLEPYSEGLRERIRRRTRRAGQRTRGRRGYQGGRYVAPHDPEPVGCGLQRPRARKHPQVRRSGTRLALTANSGDATLRIDDGASDDRESMSDVGGSVLETSELRTSSSAAFPAQTTEGTKLTRSIDGTTRK